jgi:hypothetical protein
MPNYLATYTREDVKHSLGVFAPSIDEALAQVRKRHPAVQEILSVAEKAKFLVPEPVPCWIRRDKGIQKLGSMSLENLKAIKKGLLSPEYVQQTGLFAAIQEEISSRS